MRYILLIIFLSISIYVSAQADIILHNGRIFTSDKEKLWAEAIAIKGERILTVGKNDEILRLKTPATRVIDLQARLILPGLNDAHDHAGSAYPARRFSIARQPTDPTPWEIVKDSIARITREISPGTFIITSINPDLFEDPNVRKQQLDEIAPNNPVILSAWTGHGKIVNSKALSFLGLEPGSAFLGGKIGIDNMQTNGMLEEYAGYTVAPRLSARMSEEQVLSGLKNYFDYALSLGITTVQNMCSQMTSEQVARVFSKTEFKVRVRLIAFPFTDKNAINLDEWRKLFHPLNKLNYVSGIKLVLDGTPVERLACLRQPYNDRPNEYGRLNFSEAQLRSYMEYCLAHRQQIIIHAVGDSSICTTIRTMRKMHPDDFWKDKRLRIEHAELAVVKESDIQTLKSLGIVIVQNPTHLALPKVMNDRFGAERAVYTQAMRSLLENGLVLAIGSDGPNNPFLNMMLATFHPNNPREAITLEQAVLAYTYGSAYAELMETEKGTLSQGKLADLSVLSQNIFEITPDKLPLTESILTIVGGKIVYDKKMLK